MNNAARHVLGLGAGVVALPVVTLLLAFGTERIVRNYRVLVETSVLGVVTMVGAGLLLGVLCGSRVSPLGSLVPGSALLLYGVIWSVDPYVMSSYTLDLLPDGLRYGFLTLISSGAILVLGALLVAASVPPSRWRATPKPPPVPYPRLPFTTPVPGPPPGVGPSAGQKPADGPPPPPLPYQPGA